MIVEAFSLPLARPLETATGSLESREGFLVTVEAAGERGLGEATPLPGWTESLEDCRTALAAVEDPEVALESGSQSFADRPAARHAVSLALADARARADEEPLYRHLGCGERIETVPVNATVGDGSPEETAREVGNAVAAGFPAVKVKVGARTVAADVERLRTARERLNADEPDLRVDANGAWTREQARTALDALSDLDVAYVEQPLPADDLAGHRELRDHRDASADGEDVGVGIAIDEGVAVHGVEAVLAADAADCLVCKPMVRGGPDCARRAALQARQAGLDAVVTTTVDGAIARAGAVHVAASIQDLPACGLATGDRLAADLLDDPAPVVDGSAHVPQGPGNTGRRFSGGTE